MEAKNGYQSSNIAGKGKIHIKTNDRGEKFKIVSLSAEKLQMSTTADVNIGDIVTLKVQLMNYLFMVNIKALGRIEQKFVQDGSFRYTVEFIGISDSDKQQIDDLVRSSYEIWESV